MFTARQKLIDEVNQDITDRIYTDWSQWPELLEEFPPHSAMVEGQEGHRDRANGDDADGDDEADGDDDDGEAGPDDDDDSDGAGGGDEGGEEGEEEDGDDSE